MGLRCFVHGYDLWTILTTQESNSFGKPLTLYIICAILGEYPYHPDSLTPLDPYRGVQGGGGLNEGG